MPMWNAFFRRAQPWLLIASLWIPTPVLAEVYVWIDGDGITHIADDPAAAPDAARAEPGRQALGGLWDSVLGSKETLPSGSGAVPDDRNRRLIRGAVADLQRGENARASAALSARRLPTGYGLGRSGNVAPREESAGAEVLVSRADLLEPLFRQLDELGAEVGDAIRMVFLCEPLVGAPDLLR